MEKHRKYSVLLRKNKNNTLNRNNTQRDFIILFSLTADLLNNLHDNWFESQL